MRANYQFNLPASSEDVTEYVRKELERFYYFLQEEFSVLSGSMSQLNEDWGLDPDGTELFIIRRDQTLITLRLPESATPTSVTINLGYNKRQKSLNFGDRLKVFLTGPVDAEVACHFHDAETAGLIRTVTVTPANVNSFVEFYFTGLAWEETKYI